MLRNLYTDETPATSELVGRYAGLFEQPEVRLRFLNNTLAQQTSVRERMDAKLNRFDFLKKSFLYETLLKLWLYQLIFKELRNLLPPGKRRIQLVNLKAKAPLSARLFFACYQIRHALYCLGAAALLVGLFGAYTGAAWTARQLSAFVSARRGALAAERAGNRDAQNANASKVAEGLPDYSPEKVWLVEEKDNYERYSNGARIIRDYETKNHARAFHVYGPDGAPKGETGRAPVGIVYHTSESDLMPFVEDNSDAIETRTQNLLEYVRRNASYNYVIDRFGQIYRVVRDGDAANHAGNSVWAGHEGLYVGLNESFIGVAFETKTEAGEEERLTEAQVISGRLLTQVLRSRHQIHDANTVAHGLVSVNPQNMRICFHSDWARGFPFEAMGLSDKYRIPPASVTEFGFTYDSEIVERLGGSLWPGVAEAEERFKQRAAEAGLKLEELRRKMREEYRQRMDSQKKLRSGQAEVSAE